MSLSYTLELADTTLTVEQLRSEVLAAAETAGVLAPSDDGYGADAPLLLTGGAHVDVSALPWPNEAIRDEFGIESRLAADFHLTRDSGYDAQEAEMVSVVDALLARVLGDLLMHRDYDAVLLMRRDGDLVLDTDDRWWSELLPLVQQPFQREPLRFSFWEADEDDGDDDDAAVGDPSAED